MVRPALAAEVLADGARQAPAHPSPNSGVAEAAFAAALGLRLGGTNRYGDRASSFDPLGAAGLPSAADIRPGRPASSPGRGRAASRPAGRDAPGRVLSVRGRTRPGADARAAGGHGGDGARLAAALGVDPADVLDLSASLNPVAPDPAPVVARHLDASGATPTRTAATEALAGAMGVPPNAGCC